MADYPALRVDPRGTTEEWVDERMLSRARSGSLKGRLLATAKRRTWKVAYRYLSSSDKATLESFYDTNRTLSFNFTILGNTYAVIFADEKGIQWEPQIGGQWNATVTLAQV